VLKWTEGRRKGFLTSVIRGGFRRWPPKYLVLTSSCVGKKINKATGRIASHYLCAYCLGEFPNKEVQVDHINPVVPSSGFTTWDDFINRLFCNEEQLQVLCKSCHAKKTKEENKQRKKK